MFAHYCTVFHIFVTFLCRRTIAPFFTFSLRYVSVQVFSILDSIFCTALLLVQQNVGENATIQVWWNYENGCKDLQFETNTIHICLFLKVQLDDFVDLKTNVAKRMLTCKNRSKKAKFPNKFGKLRSQANRIKQVKRIGRLRRVARVDSSASLRGLFRIHRNSQPLIRVCAPLPESSSAAYWPRGDGRCFGPGGQWSHGVGVYRVDCCSDLPQNDVRIAAYLTMRIDEDGVGI